MYLPLSSANVVGIFCAVTNRNTIHLACVFFIALAWCSLARAADWPTYRHDYQRSGISPEALTFPLSPTWVHQPAQAPAPAWPQPAKADYYLSPSAQRPLAPRVAFDHAYQVVAVGDAIYYGSTADHTVNSINTATGQANWTFFTDAPVRMAPSIDDGKVYVGSDDGVVYCLEASGGQLIWRHTAAGANNYLVANDGKFVSPFGVRTGVAVEQGTAYFGAGFFPSEGVHLCAVNAETGEEKWNRTLLNQAALQGYILLSPTRIYAPGSRANPYYFDRASGTLLGRFADRGAMGTFALLAGNSLFYGPAARGGASIAEKSTTGDSIASFAGNSMVVTANRSYLLTDTSLVAIDRSGAGQIWQTLTIHPHALILAGQTLFAGGNNEVAAFNASTGEQIWSAPVIGRAHGLAVANGQLFVSTDQGHIHCFSEDTSRKQSSWILF